MTAPLPPSPPSGWSADEFDKLIAALAAKAGVTVKATTKMVTPWRWTAGTGVFDGAVKSLRDNLEGLVKFANGTRTIAETNSQDIIELRADVEALKEAPPARPFP